VNGKEIDFTAKESWNINNASLIANFFGYECNDRFMRALAEFKREVVDSAKVTLYLEIIALRFFEDFQPPLERNNQDK